MTGSPTPNWTNKKIDATNTVNRERLVKAVRLSIKALDHWLDHEDSDTTLAHRACEIALSFEEEG